MSTEVSAFVRSFTLDHMIARLQTAEPISEFGVVEQAVGNSIESHGPNVEVGCVCWLAQGKDLVPLEVIGFRNGRVVSMPLARMSGVRQGDRIIGSSQKATLGVGEEMLGKVFDGLGRALDLGQFTITKHQPLYSEPANPLSRDPIRDVLQTGVRCIDGLLTCGMGQRVGIFGGSGVGKSTLLGMIARYTSADMNVIALVGERGREVREFIENDLGPEGLKKSIVFVSTSDQPALLRIRAAFAATAAAEFFRDRGMNVLLMMDSVTRFAMAQREVGLAAGEPPATKGYTPSVFTLLPRLLERTGKFSTGSITAFYTVLVEGDDMNDPIADTVRSILDGHVVLDRQLAARNHYPCVDVLSSISRLASNLCDDAMRTAAAELRDLLGVHAKSEDLINIGAYKPGSNPRVDRAIERLEAITGFLRQRPEEPSAFEETRQQLLSLFAKP